jgi:hypothetical protein
MTATSEKFIPIKISLLLLITFLVSCKKEEPKQEWSAAMSSPYFYRVDGCKVSYYNNGKRINSTETLLALCHDCGWSDPQAGRNSGYGTQYPDSVYISYSGLNDKLETWIFEGGATLPKNKIEQLFEQGYFSDGEKRNFNYITTGMAPGGRICVWVDFIEIKRFKIKSIKRWSNKPLTLTTDSLDEAKVKEYLNHYPIDYATWEQADKRYDIDFGFCSEDSKATYNQCCFTTKEGQTVSVLNQCDKTIWNTVFGKKSTFFNHKNFMSYAEFVKAKTIDYKINFPVQGIFEWHDSKNILFSTQIIFTEKMKKRFLTNYINPLNNKLSKYNRIIFGVESNSEYCNIWYDGPGKQEKIMRFKGKKAIMKYSKNFNDTIHYTGGFAEEISLY